MARTSKRQTLAIDFLLGALSGAAASWVMEKAQARIMSAGTEKTKQREKEAQGDLEPATYRAAEAAAHLVHKSVPDDRKQAAGEVVHYATGAMWGAVFGALAPRIPIRALEAGAAWGVVVWLVSDELLVPALGFSRRPARYPLSTHIKALASHLVYGAATDSAYRALRSVVH